MKNISQNQYVEIVEYFSHVTGKCLDIMSKKSA